MRKINKDFELKTKRAFTTHEFANLCHVSSTTIIQWLKDENLDQLIMRTRGGHRRIPEGMIEMFLNSYNNKITNNKPEEKEKVKQEENNTQENKSEEQVKDDTETNKNDETTMKEKNQPKTTSKKSTTKKTKSSATKKGSCKK